MSSYEVGDHIVDHPPIFACRKHKSFLKLSRGFVDELLAWATDLQPQNLSDVAATALGGDDQAFRLSDYLIPAKVSIFNPRKIQGHGALPYVVVLIDKRFFGIPSSYLRRRVFDGCADCNSENDPASDASFPDYRAVASPASRPAPTPGTAATGIPRTATRTVPRPPAPGTADLAPGAPAPPAQRPAPTGPRPAGASGSGTAVPPGGPRPAPGSGPPKGPPRGGPVPAKTRPIPPRPSAPGYDAPPAKTD